LTRWADKLTPIPADKSLVSSPECFFDFGMHIFPRCLKEIQDAGFRGFVSEKRWADLGRISDFHDINIYMLHQRVVSRIFTGALVTEDSTLDGNYSVKGGSTICNKAVLRDVSIGAGWVVNGARLERTVLMPLPDGYHYEIESGVELKNCVIGCGNIKSSYEGKVIVFNGSELIVNDV
jgi:NDP-sugar pyrophosphorylase family protein